MSQKMFELTATTTLDATDILWRDNTDSTNSRKITVADLQKQLLVSREADANAPAFLFDGGSRTPAPLANYLQMDIPSVQPQITNQTKSISHVAAAHIIEWTYDLSALAPSTGGTTFQCIYGGLDGFPAYVIDQDNFTGTRFVVGMGGTDLSADDPNTVVGWISAGKAELVMGTTVFQPLDEGFTLYLGNIGATNAVQTQTIAPITGARNIGSAGGDVSKPGHNLLLKGGDAYDQAAADQDGGDLILRPGAPANGGMRGVVRFENYQGDGLIAEFSEDQAFGSRSTGLIMDGEFDFTLLGRPLTGTHSLQTFLSNSAIGASLVLRDITGDASITLSTVDFSADGANILGTGFLFDSGPSGPERFKITPSRDVDVEIVIGGDTTVPVDMIIRPWGGLDQFGTVLEERNGHNMVLKGGDATEAGAVDRDGGNLILEPGVGANAGSDGLILVQNLPTSDPAVAGALWNDSGTLKISAG